MRELLTGTNEHTTVVAVDEPSHGGACHVYEIISTGDSGDKHGFQRATLRVPFQKGPIKEHGVNGIHNEDLICIVIDRLEGFQRGEYACQENALALTYLHGALGRLRDRTERRQAAGIEGTSFTDDKEIRASQTPLMDFFNKHKGETLSITEEGNGPDGKLTITIQKDPMCAQAQAKVDEQTKPEPEKGESNVG